VDIVQLIEFVNGISTQVPIVKLVNYVDSVDGFRWTPLHLACKHNNYKLSKFLLQNGADTNLSSTYDSFTLCC